MTPSKEIDHSDHPPAIVSSESVVRQVWRDPYSSETQHPKTKQKRKTAVQNGATRCTPIHRNGCKNSEKIPWMTEFLNAETRTPVLLMNHLQSLRLREVRIWVSTVLKLISLKTEIARSVKGPKLQGFRAGDAMVEPYLEL